MSISFGPHVKLNKSVVAPATECGICSFHIVEDGDSFVNAYSCNSCGQLFHSACANQWWSQYGQPSGTLGEYQINNRSAHDCPLCKMPWPPSEFNDEAPALPSEAPTNPPAANRATPTSALAPGAPPDVIPNGFWLFDYHQWGRTVGDLLMDLPINSTIGTQINEKQILFHVGNTLADIFLFSNVSDRQDFLNRWQVWSVHAENRVQYIHTLTNTGDAPAGGRHIIFTVAVFDRTCQIRRGEVPSQGSAYSLYRNNGYVRPGDQFSRNSSPDVPIARVLQGL